MPPPQEGARMRHVPLHQRPSPRRPWHRAVVRIGTALMLLMLAILGSASLFHVVGGFLR